MVIFLRRKPDSLTFTVHLFTNHDACPPRCHCHPDLHSGHVIRLEPPRDGPAGPDPRRYRGLQGPPTPPPPSQSGGLSCSLLCCNEPPAALRTRAPGWLPPPAKRRDLFMRELCSPSKGADPALGLSFLPGCRKASLASLVSHRIIAESHDPARGSLLAPTI